MNSRGMDRYASATAAAGEDLTIGHPVDARGSSRAFEKPEDARDDPSVDALRRIRGGARGHHATATSTHRGATPQADGEPTTVYRRESRRAPASPRSRRAPREREAQRAPPRRPARGSGRQMFGGERPRRKSRALAECCPYRRLPQTKLSKISTDGAVRGDTSRAPWTRRRSSAPALSMTRAPPPRVLDAPTRWPRSRRRVASTRPPRPRDARAVCPRSPSPVLLRSARKHRMTRTVGPPSRSQRARARRRRRAQSWNGARDAVFDDHGHVPRGPRRAGRRSACFGLG